MKFPLVSRREAEKALCLLVEVTRRTLTTVEAQLHEERAARRRAEAYVGQAERRRDADGDRLARALRAVAAERRQAAAYRRTIDRLTDQLLDATGYQGEPLLPAARMTLGLDKEDSQ